MKCALLALFLLASALSGLAQSGSPMADFPDLVKASKKPSNEYFEVKSATAKKVEDGANNTCYVEYKYELKEINPKKNKILEGNIYFLFLDKEGNVIHRAGGGWYLASPWISADMSRKIKMDAATWARVTAFNVEYSKKDLK